MPEAMIQPPINQPAPVPEQVQLQSKEACKAVPSPGTPPAIEHEADIALALTIEDKPEPSPSEYNKLAEVTKSFYKDFLSTRYGDDTVKDLTVSVRDAKYNAGIPEAKYNVYVELGVKAQFDKETGKAPCREGLSKTLVSELDTFELLKDYVREIKETPFENSVAIYTKSMSAH